MTPPTKTTPALPPTEPPEEQLPPDESDFDPEPLPDSERFTSDGSDIVFE